MAILPPPFLLKLFKPDADPANALSALPCGLLDGAARCLAKQGCRKMILLVLQAPDSRPRSRTAEKKFDCSSSLPRAGGV